MKKIFTLFLLCIFSLNTLPTFAENVAPMVDPNTGSLDKAPIAPATKKLNDNSKWKNYIQIVDNFVEKTNSEETLNKILERTNAVIASKELKDEFYVELVNYINQKVKAKLETLKYSDKIKEVLNPTISEADKKEANEKILQAQKNLENIFKEQIEKYSKEIKKTSDVIERGEIKSNYNYTDSKENKNYTGKFEFKDYEWKTAGFDASLKWKLEVSAKTTKDNSIESNFRWVWNVEAISKEWDVYFMLRNLYISDEYGISKEFKEFLTKLNELSNSNKFLKLSNADTQEVRKIINSYFVTGQNPISFWNKAYFEAYKKEWNKYFLRPTKDSVCVYAEKVDCEKIYKSSLEDFAKNSEVYLTVENGENKLNVKLSDSYDNASGYVTFDSKNIKEIKVEAVSTDGKEKFNLSYLRASSLNVSIKTSEFSAEFTGKLNSDNDFVSIDANLKSSFINGSFKFAENKFNWELSSKEVSGSIKWELNSQKEIINLYFDLKSNELNANLKYENKKLTSKVNAKDLFTLDIDLNMDHNNIPESGTIKIDSKDFKSNIEWKGGLFTWKTTINSGDKKIFEADHKITLGLNSINIDDNFKLFEEEIDGSLKAKINVSADYQNVNIELKAKEKGKEFIDFSFNSNTSSNRVEWLKIDAPTNFEEVKLPR